MTDESDKGTTAIAPGRVVQIHSLRSAAGTLLNERRAVVLRYDELSRRLEVKVEMDCDPDFPDMTKAVKAENLRLVPRLPLPAEEDHSLGSRGVINNFGDDSARILCQLLLWYRDKYLVPDTMLEGYAAMCFMRMGEDNFGNFNPVQMENMAGVLALANMCVQGEEEATSDVASALCEGDTMYVEVLAQTLYWTGFIGPDDYENDDFCNCPPTSLTPDQESDAYIRTMSEGPLLLLTEMTRHKVGMAVFAALADCQFYHLLVRRMLRLVAREAVGTSDGVRLGKQARAILGKGILGRKHALPRVASIATANHVLDRAESATLTPGAVTPAALETLLGIAANE